jgi:hypothetical protein
VAFPQHSTIELAGNHYLLLQHPATLEQVVLRFLLDTGRTEPAKAKFCATPQHGIIVSLDTVASLPTRASLAELQRICPAGDTTLYDDVGWQADAWAFPFVGARVLAVQSQGSVEESLIDSSAADLWTVQGDSVRLPDGWLLPRTLGELRARYGKAIVDENIGGDDWDGPHVRTCRFTYLRIALATSDTARQVPDSARLTVVEMNVPPERGILASCDR